MHAATANAKVRDTSACQVFTFGSELRKVPLIAVAPTG